MNWLSCSAWLWKGHEFSWWIIDNCEFHVQFLTSILPVVQGSCPLFVVLAENNVVPFHASVRLQIVVLQIEPVDFSERRHGVGCLWVTLTILRLVKAPEACDRDISGKRSRNMIVKTNGQDTSCCATWLCEWIWLWEWDDIWPKARRTEVWNSERALQ